jgi:hypothetical protein
LPFARAPFQEGTDNGFCALEDARAINTPVTADQIEESEETRLARFAALEEALSLIFGVMTVAYFVLWLSP